MPPSDATLCAYAARQAVLSATPGAAPAAVPEHPAAQPASAPAAAAAARPPPGPSAVQAQEDREPDAGINVFDPSLRTRKRRPGLNLFQMGAVPVEHIQRIEAKAAEDAARATAAMSGPAPHGAADIVSLAADAIPEPVPEMEWWDALVYDQPTYAPGPDGRVALRDQKITNLVEHPVAIEPPVEAPPPAPQALKLTKQVRFLCSARRTHRGLPLILGVTVRCS
jgi:pre-mRNA processing factor 3 (PRP3)